MLDVCYLRGCGGEVVISKGAWPHISSSQRNASLSNSGPAAHEPRRPYHQHSCAGTGRYVWRGHYLPLSLHSARMFGTRENGLP